MGSRGRPFRICHPKLYTAPPSGQNHDDVISVSQENLIISETERDRGEVTIELYWEVWVAVSESVIENDVRRPLAE